jgi:basic amino acid/polyamine antiporter, APA family
MGLQRKLGFPAVYAIAVGAMMGSGIFVLPGLAAAEAGPYVSLSYLLAGLLVLPAVLSKAELATAMPVSGGTYVYVERSMGRWIGTITGLATWFSLTAKTAFATVGLGTYVVLFAPSAPQKAVALGVLGVLLVVNLVGTGKATTMQIGLVTCTVFALVGLVVGGIGTADVSLLEPALPQGTEGIIAGAGLVFVSYAGVTKICSVAEEVKNPSRNLPLGMLAAQFTVMALYAVVAQVLTLNVSVEALHEHHDVTPIATLAGAVFGESGRMAFALIAIVGLTSMCNAGVMASSRFPFAMARDRVLPSQLQNISPRFGTPLLSIALTGLILGLLVTVLPVYELAKLASAMKLFIFCIANLALIVLRESKPSWYRPRFTSPMYPWVQLAGIAGGVWLLYGLGYLAVAGLTAAVVIGSAWYLFYVRRNALVKDHMAPRKKTGRHLRDPSQSRVLVPVFGFEPSAERLVWLSSAFLKTGQLDVLRLEELPDESALGQWIREDRAAERKEFSQYGRELHLHVGYTEEVTHNARATINERARQHCSEWIVMDAPRHTTLPSILNRPSAWWEASAPCNLALFVDRQGPFDGDPRDDFPRILVMADSALSAADLAHVASSLAKSQQGGHVTFLALVSESHRAAVSELHQHLLASCGSPASSRIEIGDPVELISSISENFDLLLIDGGGSPMWRTMLRGSDRQAIEDAARCSVLSIHAGLPDEETESDDPETDEVRRLAG